MSVTNIKSHEHDRELQHLKMKFRNYRNAQVADYRDFEFHTEKRFRRLMKLAEDFGAFKK
jgi:hypothetical protein